MIAIRVTVVPPCWLPSGRSRDDVRTIGAATAAIGGACHFQSGVGVFPPHIAHQCVSVRWRPPARCSPAATSTGQIPVRPGVTTRDAPALSFSSEAGRWVAAVTALGSGLAFLDATVVSIALPAIGRGFQTGVAAPPWGAPLGWRCAALPAGTAGGSFRAHRRWPPG